jgi:hypothetical protein
MLRPDDFRLYSVQASAFTLDVQRFRKAQVLTQLFPQFAERFNGEVETGIPQIPQRIALPPQAGVVLQFKAPISLTSEDNRWEFKASPDRADSIWTSRPGDDESLVDICDRCVQPLLRYPVAEGIQIGRLAFIVRRFATTPDPANNLAQHFCQPDLTAEDNPQSPLRHSQAFQLHNLKKYTNPNNINVNSWVRWRSNVVIHSEPAASFEQDLNTLAEEARDRAFTEEDLVTFFQWAIGESDRVLNLYLP